MATKYLQLRVHGLQCVQMSTNVQNFLGIPLETDPNAIDISAIITDPNAGLVAQAPPVRLGNRFDNGHRETFAAPRVVAEIPFDDDDVYPRRVIVTVNMAEKDDGAGFDDLMEDVARELTDALSDEVGDALDSGIRESEYYGRVEDLAQDILGTLFKEIGNLLGLSDDPFRPVTFEHELRAFDHAPSGTATVELREASPHRGKYVLTYGWHVSTTRAIQAAGTGATGSSSAALSRAGHSPAPYPRPFRSFRFARPMKKRGVQIARPRGKKKVPWVWYPTPLRLFTKSAVTPPK